MKKIAIVATSLLLATAMPATAGHYGGGGGTDWGAVAGAGILGALLGAATVPQPQPQIIIVVPPQPAYAPPQPAPTLPSYSPPTTAPVWYCGASRRWYPDVFACAVPWTGIGDRR